MELERPGYYAIIPADVRYDRDLSANAKLLYGEISALINEDGFCFASNGYFAERYKCSEDSVSRWITELEKQGYIKRVILRDKTGQITQRKLYLSVSFTEEQPLGNIADTPRQNCGEGIRKNAEDTNTSITDIDIKENKKRKSKRTAMDDTQLKDFWVDWITKAAAPDWTGRGKNDLYKSLLAFYEPRETKKQEPARTAAACTRLGNLLVQYGGDSPTAMIAMLDRATVSGWKSVYPPNNASTQQTEQEDIRWI